MNTGITHFLEYTRAALYQAAVYSLINAIILLFSVKVVSKYVPKYWIAYCAAFTSAITAALVGYLMGLGFAAAGYDDTTLNAVVGFITGFIIGAAIYGKLFRHPESGSIGFIKGALVSLIQIIFVAVLVGIMWLIYGAFK